MTQSWCAGVVVVACVVAHPSASAELDARQWLERMSRASHSLNYSGTFVYQHQGNLEAMQIVHARDESGERERLLSLTGPKREVLRDNQVVTCILGDRQSVVVNKSRPRSPFPVSFPTEVMDLERHYRFMVLHLDRVAGLACRVVAVEPRDPYRYGRKLCVHDESYLLLRFELTDTEGRAIEQVMFTEVEFPKKIASQTLLPDMDGADFTWHREPTGQPQSSSDAESRWQVSRVPPGFMLTDHSWHQLSEDDPGVEHWVYSDGLASVSVYIEKSMKDNEVYSGVSHRGALNAYGTMVGGHYVTVVGDVPRETVELIGKSVRAK